MNLRLCIPVLALLSYAQIGFAASLYITPNTTEIRPGDILTFTVRLDTDEGECVNAVDGVIEYSPNIVPVDISRGNSIFPVWVEDPRIDQQNRRVTFAGGIPNGYCGRIEGDPRLTNTVVELLFQAPGLRVGIGATNPEAYIGFTNESKVYLNDGFGTQAPIRTFGSSLTVLEKPGNAIRDEWIGRVEADNTPPEEFAISLQRDPSIFSGHYFIVFNTTDKQSGLDHFEVIEEPLDDFDLFLWGGVDAPWVEAKSPYLLTDQSLNSTIRVRAFDKAGNEYVATLIPEESLRGFSQQQTIYIGLIVAAGAVLLVVVGVIGVHFVRRRKKKHTVSLSKQSDKKKDTVEQPIEESQRKEEITTLRKKSSKKKKAPSEKEM